MRDPTHNMTRNGVVFINNENKRELPIAVLDSGVGGISVLNELLKLMPHENYIYFGDSKNAPYGCRTKTNVLDLTRQNLAELQSKGIKALVIACNTATGAAVRELRAENPDLCIVGIEPAINLAVRRGDCKKILVMATPLTLREDKFLRLAKELAESAEIIPLPCPRLAELIESGELDSPELKDCLSSLLSPYFKEEPTPDAVVLGCTHYPHIRSAISACLPKGVVIFDGGEGTARHTMHRLAESGLLRESDSMGRVEIVNTSGEPDRLALCQRLIVYPEKVDR